MPRQASSTFNIRSFHEPMRSLSWGFPRQQHHLPVRRRILRGRILPYFSRKGAISLFNERKNHAAKPLSYNLTMPTTTRALPSVLIMGLGYVGLPLAALVNSTQKFAVTGYDLDENKVKAIQDGATPWIDTETSLRLKKHPLSVTARSSDLQQYDVVVICVPTPVTEDDTPDLQPVLSATTVATTHLKPLGLLILESTVNPGVCEEVLMPLLAKQGHPVGPNLSLAHCPERIDPGNIQYGLADIPRVLGADSATGLAKAYDFYTSFLQAPVKKVSSLRTAEASKIVENTFRDINIAFVNELAQSFAHFDLDVKEVIEAASTKPFGFLPHYPGCGVGGHCIPVDPYYLIESAQSRGFEHRFLKLAREINQGMPAYTVELLHQELAQLGLSKPIGVAVLGISYKAGISDRRNSPAEEIWELLQTQQEGLTLHRFDPFVPEFSTVSDLDALRCHPDIQAVLIATNHHEFIQSLENGDWPHLRLIIDGRNCLSKWPPQVHYRGIGR